jgi:hypothetical protein
MASLRSCYDIERNPGLCEENHYTVYKPYESEFFTTTLLTPLYVRVNILLTLARRIVSSREEALVHKNSVRLPRCIEAPVPRMFSY